MWSKYNAIYKNVYPVIVIIKSAIFDEFNALERSEREKIEEISLYNMGVIRRKCEFTSKYLIE